MALALLLQLGVVWCFVVCIGLGHVELLGDVMLNKPFEAWFKMTALPLAHYSGV